MKLGFLNRPFADGGVSATPEPKGSVVRIAQGGGQGVRFAVERRERLVYPGEIGALESLRRRLKKRARPLLFVPYVSESAGKLLTKAGWSWVDALGNFDLRAPGLLLHRRVSSSPPRRTAPTLPRGSGSMAIVRWLIHDSGGEKVGATELATRAGVSQPRASQVFAQLEALHLVERAGRGWTAKREALLDRFLAEYRDPGGSEAFYYSLRPPMEVALKLFKRRRTKPPRLVVSADPAADLVVPHRRPTHTVVYVRGGDAPPMADWVVAQGRHDANVIVRYPTDESVFGFGFEIEAGDVLVALAHPTQLLWDLHNLGGDDRFEAGEVMRSWILKHQRTS